MSQSLDVEMERLRVACAEGPVDPDDSRSQVLRWYNAKAIMVDVLRAWDEANKRYCFSCGNSEAIAGTACPGCGGDDFFHGVLVLTPSQLEDLVAGITDENQQALHDV